MDEIVEPGAIPPELIDLPGIFVARVVKSTEQFNLWRRPERRPSDKPRLYNGKRFVLDEVAPGFAAEEVAAFTEMEIVIASGLRPMQ